MADSEVAICNLALLNIGDTGGFIATLDDPSNEAVVCKLIYAQTRDELLRAFKWPWATRHAYPQQLGGAKWAAATAYTQGQMVSYAPASANVVNMPETISTFVYYSILPGNNQGNQPDISPTAWVQLSRAAWAYAFRMPADYLYMQGVYSGRNPRRSQEIPYAIEYEATKDVNGNLVGPGTILLSDTGLPWDWSLWAASPTAPVSVELVYTAQITDPKQFPPDFTHALAWALSVKLCLGLRKDIAEAKAARDGYAQAMAEAAANALNENRPDPAPVPSWIAARGGRGGCW